MLDGKNFFFWHFGEKNLNLQQKLYTMLGRDKKLKFVFDRDLDPKR